MASSLTIETAARAVLDEFAAIEAQRLEPLKEVFENRNTGRKEPNGVFISVIALRQLARAFGEERAQ